MEQKEDQAFSSFPAPPGFYRLYLAGPDAGPPPPEPVKGNILALGEPFDTDEPFCPPLEMRKLYTTQPDGSVDIRGELLKLNKGLLFLFLELLCVLVQQPSEFSGVLSELNITLHNMAHLLNLARPLQAQQTLKCVLQSQVQDKRAALEALKAKTARIKQDILSISEQLAAAGADAAESLPKAPQQQQTAMEEG